MRTLTAAAILTATVLVAAPVHADHKQDAVSKYALVLKQHAQQLCQELPYNLRRTTPGRLIERKASEIDYLANHFLSFDAKCASTRRIRAYLDDMECLVEELDDLVDDLEERAPVRRTQYYHFGSRGFSISVAADYSSSACHVGQVFAPCGKKFSQERRPIQRDTHLPTRSLRTPPPAAQACELSGGFQEFVDS